MIVRLFVSYGVECECLRKMYRSECVNVRLFECIRMLVSVCVCIFVSDFEVSCLDMYVRMCNCTLEVLHVCGWFIFYVFLYMCVSAYACSRE